MQLAAPLDVVDLFPGLSAALLHVLNSLSLAGWERPTACAGWTVKDVVAHLLGGNLGRLSGGRDRHRRPSSGAAPQSYTELLDLINQENAAWVQTARNLSARVLIDMLALTDPQLYAFFQTLPPCEASGPSVAWAGEARSSNGFDIAREYTEKWLHQQHIREAVGQPVLAERRWLHPVLDTFLRALPYTYRAVQAAEGTAVCVRITGEAGGDWSLLRQEGAWRLFAGAAPDPAAIVRLDQDTAWRLFTKGLSPDVAQLRIAFEGDDALGRVILQMVSIMA